MISSRSGATTNRIYVITKERLKTIKGNLIAIRALAEDGMTFATSKEYFDKQSKLITETIKTTTEANEIQMKQDRAISRITLDDAVEVQKNLKVSDTEETDSHLNKKLGSLLGKSDYHDSEQHSQRQIGYRDKKQKSQIPSGRGPKQPHVAGSARS